MKTKAIATLTIDVFELLVTLFEWMDLEGIP